MHPPAARDLADEWLMLWVARGDTTAFDELHRRYHRRVYNLALRSTNDPGLAEDLTQESFLRLLAAAPRYEPRARFSTWLLGIATNLCRDAARRRTSRPVAAGPDVGDLAVPDCAPGPDEALVLHEGHAGVRAALARLSPDDRLIVILFYYEERRQTEIAALLDIPVGTVKSRLHHALKHLARLLREDTSDER